MAFFNRSTEPTYYNTFVNPMQPAPPPQMGNAGGSGQTVSGQIPMQGSGPSNNFQPGWQQPQQPQYMDQGAGKYGYGSGQDPYSAQRNLQNRQQLDQATMQALNQGLTGAAAIDAINKQMGYNTGAVWDTVRGNIDVGTGGSNGVQYDRSAGGQYGAHDYNDAYNPQMSSGMQGSMPSWGGMQNQNDPMAWRRMHQMRMNQQPNYGGGYGGGYGAGIPQSSSMGGMNTTYGLPPGAENFSGYNPQTSANYGASLVGTKPLNNYNGSYGQMPGMAPRALGNAQY